MNKFYILLCLIFAALLALLALVPSAPRGLMLWVVEGLGVLVIAILVLVYVKVVRPMKVIGNGMELLREQDFSSRLRRVGEPSADRLVDVFNRMMDELKNGRLRLRERNHLLDMLVDASPMGVVMLDFDGRVTSLNPAAREFLGCGDECIGKPLDQVPGDLARKVSGLGEGEESTLNMNDAHVYRCARLSFLDSGFQHPFILIESLTQDVMRAEREAYGKVIRMMSHEVNNTMAAVGGIMDAVGSELESLPDTADMRAALQACADRSRQMTAFITRFAEVVKIPEPRLLPTPLSRLVGANRLFLESLCTARGISMTVGLDPADPEVMMDEALMGQALINIVKNSVESVAESGRPDGHVSITVSADPPALTVTDNGTGLSAETERHIFTPFFSTKPAGHGIGLLLVREILMRHGCRFSLKTGGDRLTRFTVAWR